jgi:hypothetical protein
MHLQQSLPQLPDSEPAGLSSRRLQLSSIPGFAVRHDPSSQTFGPDRQVPLVNNGLDTKPYNLSGGKTYQSVTVILPSRAV